MPRETIYDRSGLYDMQVGWESGKDVQFGVATHDGRPIVDHLAATGDDSAGFESLWGSLDRAGCNRLIRTVRRARDAAYGRDE